MRRALGFLWGKNGKNEKEGTKIGIVCKEQVQVITLEYSILEYATH